MLLAAIGSTYKLLTPQKLECYRPRRQPWQVRGFAVSEAPNPRSLYLVVNAVRFLYNKKIIFNWR
jgi:hypothetical protein